ncbi:pyridoxamine 5'-phosphate oxidase family protein [Haloplanus rubicundus]|uniref:Pyridoxamine 5'-phosphate oxidase family protein n=1 Tax=Haloplanus rubicundus TaxID=1547898 RepID=A0A345E0R1_9EURY|nr:pyridoxamine 5'-phosphate oxidase family protein [Haloplanus rubicundus]AXG05783.1 pyridoxamine 5'-phosphate oxidase family protein [Haloplanus rubicundus]AXG09120.1 pyridoxamine 5'-phosphate oxidase family protein [Haloplanus rubicundus]
MTAHDMRRDEIDAFLRDIGTGVLSLTDGAETYAIPESFGYDDGTLYFQFGYGDDSNKLSYLSTTDVATFTAYTVDPARSVVARGPVEPVSDPADDRAAAALAGNATIPNVNVSPDGDVQFAFYRLDPDELSGRAFGATPDGLVG